MPSVQEFFFKCIIMFWKITDGNKKNLQVLNITNISKQIYKHNSHNVKCERYIKANQTEERHQKRYEIKRNGRI